MNACKWVHRQRTKNATGTRGRGGTPKRYVAWGGRAIPWQRDRKLTRRWLVPDRPGEWWCSTRLLATGPEKERRVT